MPGWGTGAVNTPPAGLNAAQPARSAGQTVRLIFDFEGTFPLGRDTPERHPVAPWSWGACVGRVGGCVATGRSVARPHTGGGKVAGRRLSEGGEGV